MKKQLSSLNPPSLDFKKCEDCGCLLIKFCKCDQFDHFKCIKNWIKGKLNKKILEILLDTILIISIDVRNVILIMCL